MAHHLVGSPLRYSQKILATASDAMAQLRWPYGCIFGFVAVRACRIVELRLTVASVAAQVMQVRH